MHTDHVISVVYTEIPKFKIATSVENGTISESMAGVLRGGEATVSYQPDEGYEFSAVTVDGTEVDTKEFGSQYIFKNVNADHNIHVSFSKIPEPIKEPDPEPTKEPDSEPTKEPEPDSEPEQKPGPEEESDIKTETEQLPVTPEKPEAESENIEEREAFPEEVPEVPNTSSFDDTPNTSFSLTFVSLLLISIIGVIVSAMMADDRYYKNKK